MKVTTNNRIIKSKCQMYLHKNIYIVIKFSIPHYIAIIYYIIIYKRM